MKILLLDPSYSQRKLLKDPVLSRCAGVPLKAPYIYPPIGLAYIASALRDFLGVDVKILDAQVDDFDIEMTNEFDLVVINTSTPTINNDIRLSQKIKELSKTRVVFIGLHSAYFHEELIEFCDFVVRGEPDAVLVDLVGCLEKGQDIKGVRGITWKDKNNKIHVNEDGKPVENLDSLPFQAIDLLSKKYFDIIAKRKPIAFTITSRSCPFQCKFCSAGFYSKKYRYRSAKHVFEEVKFLVDRGFKDLTFFDDSFTVNKKRVIEICNLIQKERLDFAWRCLSRVDTVDKEMLRKMGDSGCYQIQFGVESGDPRMLNLMKKGTTPRQVKEAFKLCDDLKIETVGFFMLGYPGETQESIKNTVRLANEIKPDFVSFNLFTPLPGSEIFDSLPRKEWEKYDFTSTSFCDIPSGEIAGIIGKAYRDYYLKLSYIWRRIRKTEEPFRIIKQNVKFWMKRSGVLWDFIKS
ncbi:MAG: radical SAM protein [Candidatus Aenigmarchaeota archaeon]|nr:radical SAM protein [Candidatus Aenigmarchaeota archaeon]